MRSRALVCAGLAVSMIQAPGAARGAKAPDPALLSREVVPTSESVRLRVDARRQDYSGSVRIELRVAAATDTFRFHAREMNLTRLTLRRGSAVIPITTASRPFDMVAVRAARPLEPGDYTLEIAFTNDFDTRATSLYKVVAGGNAYLFTQFEAADARGAFPCWDEPAFKIPWKLTLVVPKAHRAIANTLPGSETVSGEWRTVTFHRTPPLPSYLVAIAAGPLESVPITGLGVPGRVVTIKGSSHLAAEAARVTPRILAALERYFGRKYPYEKLDLIAVPEFGAGAMENAGAITYREEILLMDPASTSPSQRRRLIAVTAHEVAHMWFGDLVTMQWWDDIWLNESFASWMGDKITDEVAPQFKVGIDQTRNAQVAMDTDSRLTTHAIRGPVLASDNLAQIFDELAYQKGQAVLGMLERWLGSEAFRQGVIDYLGTHAFGNATADDLWAALSKAAGHDVTAVARSFLDQKGVPIVTVEPLTGNRVRLYQRRFLNHGLAESGGRASRWKIPLTLRYPVGDRLVTQNVLLTDAVQTVQLESPAAPAWIHPNADERGYYRWNIPGSMLASLVDSARTRLSARERVGFVGNARALLFSGQLHGDQFLRLLPAFAADTEPQVVGAVLEALNAIREPFVTAQNRADFAAYVRRTLRPALDGVGWTPVPGEPQTMTLLRPRLLDWLGDDGGDAEVLERCRQLAESYMKDRASIDPSLADVAIGLAALHGDAVLFEAYRHRFETTKLPDERQRFLGGLGSFTDTTLISRALRYALTGPLRPQEILVIAEHIDAHPEFKDRVFEWTLAEFDAINPRLPSWNVADMPWWASGCSGERLAKARAFYSVPAHSPVGTAKELEKMAASVRDCVSLQDREGAAASRALSQLAGMK